MFGVPSLFHTLTPFLLVLFCHRSFLGGMKICQFTAFSYMCSICIYSFSIFLFLYYCSLSLSSTLWSVKFQGTDQLSIRIISWCYHLLSDLMLLYVYLSQKVEMLGHSQMSRMQHSSVQQYRLHTGTIVWTEFEWCKEANLPVSLASLQRSLRNAKGKPTKAMRCIKFAFLKMIFSSPKFYFMQSRFKWNKVLFESSSD